MLRGGRCAPRGDRGVCVVPVRKKKAPLVGTSVVRGYGGIGRGECSGPVLSVEASRARQRVVGLINDIIERGIAAAMLDGREASQTDRTGFVFFK